jgi:hypothetical protein
MQLQPIQWNISSRSDPNEIAGILPVACLASFVSADSSHYNLHLRPRGRHERRNRMLGVAIFGFNITAESCSLVERSVFPERMLDATFKHNHGKIGILTFHSLTGVD